LRRDGQNVAAGIRYFCPIFTYGESMKRLLIAFACIALSLPCIAQNAGEPASKDDVILLLRTMQSHDMMQRTVAVQFESMRVLLRDQLMKEKGSVPADFDVRIHKVMDSLAKDMPYDEILQAMIPAYQKHFNHGDIEAMNAFYSSPVGQKVLQELPAVMQEGMREAMPIMSKYLSDWQDRMKHEFDETKQPEKNGDIPVQQ
jgi:uncharacterized protein